MLVNNAINIFCKYEKRNNRGNYDRDPWEDHSTGYFKWPGQVRLGVAQ